MRSLAATAQPADTKRRRARRVLGIAALLTGILGMVLGLAVAPPDAVQGQAQRLMYLHVPAAWVGYLAVGLVSLASIPVLLRRGSAWDAWARAGSELGVVMLGLTILEGSVWGQSAWGVWWAWDPRLVTAALLFLTYVGYVTLRWAWQDTLGARRRLAWLGLAGLVEVPVVHFSVLWWRSLHQPPTLLRPELSPPIAGSMLTALLVALLAFTLGGAWYVLRRVEQLSAAPTESPAVGQEVAPILVARADAAPAAHRTTVRGAP